MAAATVQLTIAVPPALQLELFHTGRVGAALEINKGCTF